MSLDFEIQVWERSQYLTRNHRGALTIPEFEQPLPYGMRIEPRWPYHPEPETLYAFELNAEFDLLLAKYPEKR